MAEPHCGRCSKLKLKEMGSRYLFIVLLSVAEKHLARGDYQRQIPIRRDDRTGRKVGAGCLTGF